MDGLEFCNECPFLCYKENKKTKEKKYVCGPYRYYYTKDDFVDENKIKVPEWCGNRKRNEE